MLPLDDDGQRQPATKLATGMMDTSDIQAVTTLAKMVPTGGVIVDVGTLLGMSASLWCIHSEASRIICIDLWKCGRSLESFRKNNGGEISKEAFLRNVPDNRIEAIQGRSPSCVSGWWSLPVDFYWEDADHNNPWLARNIRFWSRQVKPGGIVCGHDYHLPDVIRESNALAAKWGVALNRLGTSVWWIRKPIDFLDQKPDLAQVLVETLGDHASHLTRLLRLLRSRISR